MSCDAVARRTFWELSEERALPLRRSFSDSCLLEADVAKELSALDAASPRSWAEEEALSEVLSIADCCVDSDCEILADSDDESNRSTWASTSCTESSGEALTELDSDDRTSVYSNSDESDAPEMTTLVFKNFFPEMRWHDLCTLLDKHSFARAYNLVYMPANFKKMESFGFGFVNFVSHEQALRALNYFQGLEYQLTAADTRTLEVDWSNPHQGLGTHLQRFRNCPVMHPCVPTEFKPVQLVDGRLVDFPAPTQRVIPPREFRKRRV
jgi:hypothetical protein